jgi:hypothetical protein
MIMGMNVEVEAISLTGEEESPKIYVKKTDPSK